MRRLFIILMLLSFVMDAIAQGSNHIVNMLEDAVIEYYDTLSTYQNYRLQKHQRGELFDTNIYLYLNCIDELLFMENLHEPNEIPQNIFYHTIGKYQFFKRGSMRSSEEWSTCRRPKASKTRPIEVIEISYLDLIADTVVIHLSHVYFSYDIEWINGRCYTVAGFAISGGATWEYVFSEESRKWVCIKKIFREI